MRKLKIGDKLVAFINSADFKAFIALRDAINDALSTQTIKQSDSAVALGEKIIELINNLKMSKKSIDDIFKPVTNAAISKNKKEVATRNGQKNKKPVADQQLLKLWNEWGKNPRLYKNKTAFCKFVESKSIFTSKIAAKKVDELRISNSFDTLENILPKKNK